MRNCLIANENLRNVLSFLHSMTDSVFLLNINLRIIKRCYHYGFVKCFKFSFATPASKNISKVWWIVTDDLYHSRLRRVVQWPSSPADLLCWNFCITVVLKGGCNNIPFVVEYLGDGYDHDKWLSWTVPTSICFDILPNKKFVAPFMISAVQCLVSWICFFGTR